GRLRLFGHCSTDPHPGPLPGGEGARHVLPLPLGEGRGEGRLATTVRPLISSDSGLTAGGLGATLPSRISSHNAPDPATTPDRRSGASPAPLRWANRRHLPMPDARIRQQIAYLAAQLMYQRAKTEYFTAKRKAARQLGVEYRYRPADLP